MGPWEGVAPGNQASLPPFRFLLTSLSGENVTRACDPHSRPVRWLWVWSVDTGPSPGRQGGPHQPSSSMLWGAEPTPLH